MKARKLSKKRNQSSIRRKKGKGIIDRLIDKLPIELHIPKYQYCGPGTKLEKRLARGDPGINPLDAACKEHDIAYSKYKSSKDRAHADKELQKKAMQRVFANDASFNERATALSVSAAMKAKRLFTKRTSGAGLTKKNCQCGCESGVKKGNGISKKFQLKKRKQISLAALIKKAKFEMKKSKPENLESAINVAIKTIKRSKKGKHVKIPRTIKLPTRTGGFLPLVPIFAGLSALGSIIGSTTGVVSAINKYKNAQKELEENKRHNSMMEAIAIGNEKNGQGFYLHRNKTGSGFYLSPKQLKNQ